MEGRQLCELCKCEASVYCDADSAFLCWSCDRRVHTANFLVARHVRRVTCSTCGTVDDPALSFAATGLGSGSEPDTISSTSTSTSASSCISTADSESPPPPPPRRRSAAERVMEGWGRAMGLGRRRRCADAAARVMEECAGEMAAVPLRAAMAAALWFAAARVCGVRTCEGMLRKLERCSGVPAKAIVSCELRISRALGKMTDVIEEGWGECP